MSEGQRAAAVRWAQALLDDKGERVACAKALFADVDADGSGSVGLTEAAALVQRLAHDSDLKLPPAHKIRALLQRCDKSGDGELQVGAGSCALAGCRVLLAASGSF